ncbi:MAG: hypothetical protein ACYC6M_13560, partial [Terriglobales bacterium]
MLTPNPTPAKPSDTLSDWASEAPNVVDPGQAAKQNAWGAGAGQTLIPPASWFNFIHALGARWKRRQDRAAFHYDQLSTCVVVTFTSDMSGVAPVVNAGSVVKTTDAANNGAVFLTNYQVTVPANGGTIAVPCHAANPGPVKCGAATLTDISALGVAHVASATNAQGP